MNSFDDRLGPTDRYSTFTVDPDQRLHMYSEEEYIYQLSFKLSEVELEEYRRFASIAGYDKTRIIHDLQFLGVSQSIADRLITSELRRLMPDLPTATKLTPDQRMVRNRAAVAYALTQGEPHGW